MISKWGITLYQTRYIERGCVTQALMKLGCCVKPKYYFFTFAFSNYSGIGVCTERKKKENSYITIPFHLCFMLMQRSVLFIKCVSMRVDSVDLS